MQRWKAALRETLKRENELRKQNEKYNAELSLASGRFIHTLEELKVTGLSGRFKAERSCVR